MCCCQDSWHHATLNVADTIGIAFNHIPPPAEMKQEVTPRDFHWRIAPLDILSPQAASNAIAAAGSLPADCSAVGAEGGWFGGGEAAAEGGQGEDAAAAECMHTQIDAAVAQV
eukprot:COSAG04_NODE_19326_length_419_cov_0.506250_1_plen_112_part_10